MKYLVTTPETQERLPKLTNEPAWTIVHFFFNFRAAKGLVNTEEGMFRSILHQILNKLQLPTESLLRHGLDLDSVLETSHLHKTATMISKLLDTEGVKVLLFVDGLDECGSSLRLTVQSLKEIRAQTGLRLCLASRPEPQLQALLRGCIEVKMQDYNAAGIRAYISNAVDDIESSTGFAKTSTEQLFEKIISSAEGVFLYCHFATELVIERLVQGFTHEEIQEELRVLPKELSELYNRLFERIPLVCRAEVALLLHLIESAEHKVSLNMLYGAWLVANHLANPQNTAPKKIDLNQFRIRLLGLLGGIVEVKDSTPALSQPDPNEPLPRSDSWGSSNSLPVQDYRVLDEESEPEDEHEQYDKGLLVTSIYTTYDAVEVRLYHESVRAHIRDYDLVGQWASEDHIRLLPHRIWALIYSDVLIDASKRFGRRLWQPLEAIGESMIRNGKRASTTLQPNATSMGRAIFLSTMLHHVELMNVRLRPLFTADTFVKMLADAIRYIHAAVKQIDPEEETLLSKLSIALRSPLILCYDMLQDGPKPTRWRSHDTESWHKFNFRTIAQEGRFWRHDLSFAAAHRWEVYIKRHGFDLSRLDILEKDFLFECSMHHGVTSWYNSGTTLSAYHDRLLQYLLKIGPIENRHIALFLASQHYSELPDFMRRLLYDDGAISSDPDPIVSAGRHNWLLYRPYAGKHLLEVWAGLRGMLEPQLRTRLDFLVELGVDINEWRSRDGEHILHFVLDDCDKNQEYRAAILKLSILACYDANFFLLDANGKTAMQRARELCRNRKALNDLYLRQLAGVPGLFNSQIVVLPAELDSFGHILDELEADYRHEQREE